MSDIKQKFGSSNQAITITLNNLANSTSVSTGYRQSTVVDNSVNLYTDAMVFIKILTGTIAGTPYLNVFAYGTADGGTTYTDGASGTDGAYTSISLTSPNLRYIGTINAPASTTTYTAGPFSIASAFGGVLPEKWGIVIQNLTGGALGASTNSIWYQGAYSTVA